MTEQDEYDLQIIQDIDTILDEYLASSDLDGCDQETQDNVHRRFAEMRLFLSDIREAYDQGSGNITPSKAIH